MLPIFSKSSLLFGFDSEIFYFTGRDILKKNGSAVDAAVASLFCLGLFSMHSTGVGGGGFMMVYKRKTGVAESYDYKCTAPGKAREDMFMNEGNRSSYGELTTNALLVYFD